MHIGYDGKRAYQNNTGLGHYSRSLITILSQQYPDNNYTLFTPKQTQLFNPAALNGVQSIFPSGKWHTRFPALWRRTGMVKDIAAANIQIYHGLSNELPKGLEHTGVKSVVTVHDLIYERFPETYGFDERYVHRWKIKHACRIADKIIAISAQTKQDLIDFYQVPADKITICYQSCNPIFKATASEAAKASVRQRYHLPGQYFLFVSSIAPRKNLVTLCKAMIVVKDQLSIPLVVIGNGKAEKAAAKQLMANAGIADRLILLNEMPEANEAAYKTSSDFPAIYQQATALIYPSIFEGFGLPLLEAMWSNLPVISSNTSSMPEVCGDAALYFSPYDVNTLAKHLLDIATNKNLVASLVEKGYHQARKFTPATYAKSIMQVYQSL